MTCARRLVIRIAVATAACLALWQLLTFLSLDNGSLPDVASLSPFQVLDDSLDTITLDFVRRANKNVDIGLSTSLLYTRRCFTPSKDSAIDRIDIQHIEEPLITKHLEVKLRQRGVVANEACVPLPLSISEPYPATKYHDLAFGMATTYDRLVESLDTIAHWASGSESLLVVIVENYNNSLNRLDALLQKYHDRDVNALFIPPYSTEHSNTQSHFMVLNKMVEESGPETRWFGLLDDDTFFPHLAPLSAALGTNNHDRDIYIGAVAEHWGSLSDVGFMGFGGAGVYLSAHLARKLGAMDQALSCLDEFTPDTSGDYIIMQCVERHSNARLTILPDLYQHDMVGSLRGFFESGTQPLNFHHWKSWYHEPVLQLARTTGFCGECFLQRWSFGSDTVLSNGYSIGVYADGLGSVQLNRMERTWNNKFNEDDPTFSHTLGPLRDRIPDDKRKTYFLKYTEVEERFMRQLYVLKSDGESKEPDEVVELVWTR